MPNYQEGKVYRILQDGVKTVYIGSTCQTLSQRMAGHRKGVKQTPTHKLYKLMAEVGIEHFSIELIVDCPCDRREILNRAEGEQIRLHGTIADGCNKKLAGRTGAEWQRLPEVKAKIKKYLQIPEVHAKIRAKAADYYQRPEIKTRKAEYNQLPEVKAKTKERQQLPEYKEGARIRARRRHENAVQAKVIANKYAMIKRPELQKLCIARQLHTSRYNGRDFYHLKREQYMEMLKQSDAATAVATVTHAPEVN